MTIEVLEPGPLTSVQTPAGRPGWQHLGVPVGGAADAWSALLANRLVGSPADAPLLEATLSGPTLRLVSATLVAVTGGEWDAALDGIAVPPNQARAARAGSILRVGSGAGARAYVAIAGMRVVPVLGSAATDLRTGFGGHEGRALRAGDLLDGAGSAAQPMRWIGEQPDGGPIRVLPGPHAAWFAPDTLTIGAWRATDAADRAGVRLDGAEIDRRDATREVASMGLPVGAIQIPPDGRPIVMLADGPVTGGYPVIARVIRADIGRVAQLRPGEDLRFAAVTVADAVAAHRTSLAALDALEAFSLTGDDEAGWAGALE